MRMDGRVVEDRGGTGIETLDGVALLGEVLVVTGAGNRMAPRQHLVVGDGVEEVLDGGGTGTGIGIGTVMMITGGCHRLGGIVILHLPGVVRVVEATVVEVGEGQGTRGLAVRPAEIPGTIENPI